MLMAVQVFSLLFMALKEGTVGLAQSLAACGIEQVTRFPLPSRLYVQLDSCRSLLLICTSVVL